MSVTMSGKGRTHTMPSCAVFKTAIGWCGLVMERRKVRRLYIGYAAPRQLKHHLRNDFGDDICLRHSAAMRMIIQKLRSYCSGKHVSLSGVPMDWSSLTPFQQKVLRAAAQIPCGSVDTYGGISRRIGSPHSARAVGNALATNPFPLIVPCHRIIKGNGRIGGFSGPTGIQLKERLLRLERRGARQRSGVRIPLPG